MSTIYRRTLTRRANPWPEEISPRVMLTEWQMAAFLGVSTRQARRWRVAGCGPTPEPQDRYEWNQILYQAVNVITWRSSVLGQLSLRPSDIVSRWEETAPEYFKEMRQESLGQRPLRLVSSWRRKGERKRRKCPPIARIQARLAEIEFREMELILLPRLMRLTTVTGPDGSR